MGFIFKEWEFFRTLEVIKAYIAIFSTIIFINGGMGLLKIFLKRFLHISIFKNVRFPLHDHMKKNHGWSPAQVLIKFLTLQILVTVAVLGLLFKIR